MGCVRLWLLMLCGAGLLLGEVSTGRAQTAPSLTRDAAEGKRLFHNKTDKEWAATGLTCKHCHSDFNEKKIPPSELDKRPGHMLYNSGRRSAWHRWDGTELTTLDAAIASCMERWMTEREGAEGGKPAAKHHIRKIVAYLLSEPISPERKSKPIEPRWVKSVSKLPEDRLLKAGDPNLGAPIFRRACESCHASDASGPAPSLVRNGYSRYQIAKKIRGIQNKGLEGLVMPAFPLDRLSNRELINVVAFVYQM
jgi:mono/diheme cytochrome c family protein